MFLGYAANDTLGKAGELPEMVAACSALAAVPPGRTPWFALPPSEVASGGQVPSSSVLVAEGTLSCLPGLFPHPSLSMADEAQEAEAIRILTSILNIRETTSDNAPQKTVFILKTLVMLYHLMMNPSKASFLRKAACLQWRWNSSS